MSDPISPRLRCCCSHAVAVLRYRLPRNSSTLALIPVSLPSVVSRSPSAVRSVMSALASNAVA